MIHEVDVVLRSLIRDNALPDVITDVEFDAPTRWVPRESLLDRCPQCALVLRDRDVLQWNELRVPA